MVEPLPLGTDEVHVWLVEPERVHQADLLRRYEGLLSDAEREREQHFVFARHRHTYLVAHALVRATLSRYAPVDPAAWTFVHNVYGRPEIAADGPLRLRFNLSHTDGLAAVAVAREVNVGVDVEDTQRRAEIDEVATHYFASAEVASLRALVPAARRERFFDLWTLKEAYIKARGLGLSLPLANFSFTLQPGSAPRVSFDASSADDPADWQFALFRPTPRHRLALAVRSRRAPTFRLRHTVPLGSGV